MITFKEYKSDNGHIKVRCYNFRPGTSYIWVIYRIWKQKLATYIIGQSRTINGLNIELNTVNILGYNTVLKTEKS